MEALIPIFRLIHFVGFALLLGGTASSIIITKKGPPPPTKDSIALAYASMHLVAAPGLTLLLLTGILHSAVIYWDNFRGAGYMHVKVTLAFILLLVMIADMRTQKNILKQNPETDILLSMVKTRQTLALIACGIILTIMWLVSFRPF